MSQWQPIETAPKDGTEVLVYLEDNVFSASYDGRCWAFPFAAYHGCGCCSNDIDEPTHWMPLPSPPTQGEQT